MLVDFWASWCAPCKASFPAYSRLQSAYADRGLVVVAVSVDEDASAFAAFVARLKPSFATVHDPGHKLVGVVRVPTMPTSYLVDRSGKVRFMHPGFHGEQTERELRLKLSRSWTRSPLRHEKPAPQALAAGGPRGRGGSCWEGARPHPPCASTRGSAPPSRTPTMNPDRDPEGTAMTEHVYFSREAASGGRGVGGSGCGCN